MSTYRPIEDVKQGDVIEKNKLKREVLGICGNCVLNSDSSGAVYALILKNLKSEGWSIVQPEIPEVTMEEVCEKFGHEVKIKKN
jgi:hypothetical protein